MKDPPSATPSQTDSQSTGGRTGIDYGLVARIAFTAVTAAAAVAAIVNPWTLWLAAVLVLGLLVDRRVRQLRNARGSLNLGQVASDAWAVSGAVGVALLSSLAVTAVATGWVWSQASAQSVATQLDEIERVAADSDLYPVKLKKLDLHGSGSKSYLVVFRHRLPHNAPPVGTSDEIRIYDVTGTNLHLAFSFSPEAPRGIPGNCWVVGTSGQDCLPSSVAGRQPGYEFSLKAVRNVWAGGPAVLGDWRQQLVVGVPAPRDFGAFLPMPIAVYWSPADSEYKIRTLITNPWTRGIKLFNANAYKRLHKLRDPTSSITLRGHVADGWSIARGASQTVFLAIFGSSYENPRGRALVGGAAPIEGSPPETWRCSLDRPHGAFVRVRAPGGATSPSPAAVLARTWRSHRKQCDALPPSRVPNPHG